MHASSCQERDVGCAHQEIREVQCEVDPVRSQHVLEEAPLAQLRMLLIWLLSALISAAAPSVLVLSFRLTSPLHSVEVLLLSRASLRRSRVAARCSLVGLE